MIHSTMCSSSKFSWIGRLFLAITFVILFHEATSFVTNKRRFGVIPSPPVRRRRTSSSYAISILRFSNPPLGESHDSKNEDAAYLLGFPKDTVAIPLIIILISQFVLFIGVGAIIPSIPLYGKAIGLSSSSNGLVISAPAVALLLLAKWGGNFADVSRKPAMLIGMAIIAASDIGTALANGLVMLIVARLGLGAGRCISESGERGMLADLAGRVPELRGRALAAQQAVVALGIAIGAPLGGVVVERYGPRATFLCVSAAAILVFIIYLFLPETKQSAIITSDHSKRTDDDGTRNIEAAFLTPSEAVDTNKGLPEGSDWSDLLAISQWRGLALCQSGATFGFVAKVMSIPILATSTLPGGAAGAGVLVSLAGLSGLLGAPFGGWLTDQTSAKSTAILSGLFSATGLVLIPFALNSAFLGDSNFGLYLPSWGVELQGNALAFSAVVLAWSTGAAAQGPALIAYAQELAPKGGEATALALPRAAGDGTYIVAPFILGLVADHYSIIPGVECAVAGTATCLGVAALAALGEATESTND